MKLQKKRPVAFPKLFVVEDAGCRERSKASLNRYASGAFSTIKNGMSKFTGIFHPPKVPLPDLGPMLSAVVLSRDNDVTCQSAKPVITTPVMPLAADKLVSFHSSNLLVANSAGPTTSETSRMPEVVISSPLAFSSSSITSSLTTSHRRASFRADSAFSESAPIFAASRTRSSNNESSINSSKGKLHRALRILKSRLSFKSWRSSASGTSKVDSTDIDEIEYTSQDQDVSPNQDTLQDSNTVQVQDASLIKDQTKAAPVYQHVLTAQSVPDTEDIPHVEDMYDIQDEPKAVAQPEATDVEDIADGLLGEGSFVSVKVTTDDENVTNIENGHHSDNPSNVGSATSEDGVSLTDDDNNDDDHDDDHDFDNKEGENDTTHGQSNDHCGENNVECSDGTDEAEEEKDDNDDDEEETESTNKDGRADWGKMNAIPLDTFLKLLEWKLPADRKMLASCVSGTTRGTYHYVVFIKCLNSNRELEQFVVKVPAHGVRGNWREEDGYMLCQEAETMKYLFEFTTMPIPEVIAYSPDAYSRWGFPYIIMSRLPGHSAANIWCDDGFDFGKPNRMHDIPSPQTEKKRINFLRSLAHEMSKLKDVRFKGIGIPCLGNLESDMDSASDALPVDSTFIWTSADDPESVEERRACYSTQEYTGSSLEKWESINDGYHANSIQAVSVGGEPDDYLCQYHGVCKMLGIVFAHPVFQSTGEEFFLQHDDLDLQNVLTDDEGNVTGIIDWAGSLAMPRCVAHAAVPNFLRRDWFPDQDGTAAHLYFRMEHYRQVYVAAMVEAGNPDALYTTKSGLYQAAFAAIFSGTGGDKYDLIERLLDRVPHITKDAVDFTTALGNPSLCWQIEDMVQAELYKILDPKLPHINLQELVWDVAVRAFMAEFEAFFAPPTFEELVEAWMADFVRYFRLEENKLENH